jgi:hypothetical protein
MPVRGGATPWPSPVFTATIRDKLALASAGKAR